MAWLHQLGAIVKGYALTPEYEQNLFSHIPISESMSSTIGDIRDKNKLRHELLSFQPDFIFHLAAQPLVRRSYRIPSETFEVNAIGTANLLEAVIDLPGKCTVVVITTDKVYENKEQHILYKEDDRLGGYDPYSASKACTELVVSSFSNSFFNPKHINRHHKGIVSARAGNVIGGGDFSEDRIVPDITRSLMKKQTIEVRNPFAVRPWQHVLEPLGGYLLLGSLMHEDPIKYHGAYNFGPLPEDHLSVQALVEQAIQSWGSGSWRDVSDASQPHEAGLLKLNISKAEIILNWRPKLTAAEAIDWTLSWYKQADHLYDFTVQQIHNYMSL